MRGAKCAHPPVRVEEREGKVVHHSVGVVISVGVDLHAHAEALETQVEVRAHSALYAHCVADVLLAVVAVVQCPAGSHRHASGILHNLQIPLPQFGGHQRSSTCAPCSVQPRMES